MDEIVRTLRAYLARETGCELEDLDPEASLLEAGIVDSGVMIGLLNFLEQRWGITVPPADLVPEHFGSLGAMARYIDRRIKEERPR